MPVRNLGSDHAHHELYARSVSEEEEEEVTSLQEILRGCGSDDIEGSLGRRK